MVSHKVDSAAVFKNFHSHNHLQKMATVCALLLLVAAAAAAQGADKSFAAIENTQLFIPASAHVSGAGDANWRTDLEIFNPGQTRASVTVALLKAKTSNHNPQTRSYTLDPGEALRFEDALMSIFGFDGGAAIRVVNTSGMAAVTSRTYNLQPDGTFGQFVGGVISHTAIQPGQEGRIIQLTHNRSTTSGFRTNIGFVNATGSSITVQVALYRADGSYLGTKSYPLQPYMFQQEDKIFQKVVSGDVDDGYAVLTTSTAGGAFFAYGVVIDNRTGRPHLHHPGHPQCGLVAASAHADPDHDGHNHAVPDADHYADRYADPDFDTNHHRQPRPLPALRLERAAGRLGDHGNQDVRWFDRRRRDLFRLGGRQLRPRRRRVPGRRSHRADRPGRREQGQFFQQHRLHPRGRLLRFLR